MKYKCSMCGNTHYVRLNVIKINDDGNNNDSLLCFELFENGMWGYANCEALACTECGYVSFIAHDLVKDKLLHQKYYDN